MSSSTRSIDVLLRQLPDEALRNQLVSAVNSLRHQTQFGLVFEGHHPEVSRLPGIAIRVNSLVTKKADRGNKLYRVTSINDGMAVCQEGNAEAGDSPIPAAVPLDDLVACRRFGDPIYPSLELVGSVARGGSKPWHLLIEADNYHALQLLRYTHLGKVDVIYIDPPYNTGARDWKYNNDYVDTNDPFRHSKWLSFMEKRLELAALLLKPDGVIVVTIDEHEVHHLACLLEQVFPEAYQQMVTIVINPAGVTQGRFSRVEEHALFVFKGASKVFAGEDDFLTPVAEGSMRSTNNVPQWESLLRRGTGAKRSDRKSMFYPVIVDPGRQAVIGVGEPLPFEEMPDFDLKIDGFPVAWPIRTDLSQGRWKVGPDMLKRLLAEGFVRLGRYDPDRRTWGITYVTRKIREQIQSGEVLVRGKHEVTGAADLVYAGEQTRPPRTVWSRNLHNAGPHGTDFLRLVFGEGEKFSFPKSVYSVRDTLSTLLRDKKEAVVLDFFGGSGTTYNAIALLNAADGGHRQCILVTNNEVSEESARTLTRSGAKVGDERWQEQGICQAVTWPRVRYVTEGKRTDGTSLPGEYFTGAISTREQPPNVSQITIDGESLSVRQRRDLVRLIPKLPMSAVKGSAPYLLEPDRATTILWDIAKRDEWLALLDEVEGITDVYVFTANSGKFSETTELVLNTLPPRLINEEARRPLSEGFEENVAYLRQGFLDADEIARGNAFDALLPILWILAGAKGRCPEKLDDPRWIISPENGFAVLLRERHFQSFKGEVQDLQLSDIFLVTDALDAFREMHAQLNTSSQTHMLYSSFLRNFQTNAAGPTS